MDSMINIIDWIGRFQILLALLILLIGFWAFFRLFLARERRLIKNISRKIVIYYPAGKDFEPVKRMLENTKFLKLEEPSTSVNMVASIVSNKLHALLILGYGKGDQDNFFELFEKAKSIGMPIIVYPMGDRLDPEESKIIGKYPYHSMATTPLRLLNDVFATLASFNNPSQK